MAEGVEAILVGTGGDDLLTVLGGGVEVVVVVVEPDIGKSLSLTLGEHSQGDTGLHAKIANRLDHLGNPGQPFIGR